MGSAFIDVNLVALKVQPRHLQIQLGSSISFRNAAASGQQPGSLSASTLCLGIDFCGTDEVTEVSGRRDVPNSTRVWNLQQLPQGVATWTPSHPGKSPCMHECDRNTGIRFCFIPGIYQFNSEVYPFVRGSIKVTVEVRKLRHASGKWGFKFLAFITGQDGTMSSLSEPQPVLETEPNPPLVQVQNIENVALVRHARINSHPAFLPLGLSVHAAGNCSELLLSQPSPLQESDLASDVTKPSRGSDAKLGAKVLTAEQATSTAAERLASPRQRQTSKPLMPPALVGLPMYGVLGMPAVESHASVSLSVPAEDAESGKHVRNSDSCSSSGAGGTAVEPGWPVSLARTAQRGAESDRSSIGSSSRKSGYGMLMAGGPSAFSANLAQEAAAAAHRSSAASVGPCCAPPLAPPAADSGDEECVSMSSKSSVPDEEEEDVESVPYLPLASEPSDVDEASEEGVPWSVKRVSDALKARAAEGGGGARGPSAVGAEGGRPAPAARKAGPRNGSSASEVAEALAAEAVMSAAVTLMPPTTAAAMAAAAAKQGCGDDPTGRAELPLLPIQPQASAAQEAGGLRPSWQHSPKGSAAFQGKAAWAADVSAPGLFADGGIDVAEGADAQRVLQLRSVPASCSAPQHQRPPGIAAPTGRLGAKPESKSVFVSSEDLGDANASTPFGGAQQRRTAGALGPPRRVPVGADSDERLSSFNLGTSDGDEEETIGSVLQMPGLRRAAAGRAAEPSSADADPVAARHRLAESDARKAAVLAAVEAVPVPGRLVPKIRRQNSHPPPSTSNLVKSEDEDASSHTQAKSDAKPKLSVCECCPADFYSDLNLTR